MFLAAVGRRRRNRGGGAGGHQKPDQHWSQQAIYAEGYYVECGTNIRAEPLHTQLKIPALRLKTANASYCQLPQDLRSSTLTFMDTAEVMLANAAEAYDKAITAAGFSTEETHRMRSATKAVLPLTFRLIGPQLNSRDAKAGAQQMQEVERLLQQFAQALTTLAGSLMGLVSMDPPRQPLALSALLQLLTSDQVNLATSRHPVIEALFHYKTGGGQLQGGGSQRGGGIRGRLGNLGQAVGPGGGREQFGSPQQGGGGGLLANRPRPIHGLISMATSSGQGGNNSVDHRQLARDISQEICMADLIEFQRLTEQFEEIREWLLT